ncbi:MAG TPA: sigma-70 family RNA polymerase sigma factor [Kofleriaceae bacterium]
MSRVTELTTASGIPATSIATALAAWETLLAQARKHWPAVTFDDDALVTFIAQRLSGDELGQALSAALAADLALAGACVAGEPTAHAAFDAVLTEVDAAGVAVGATRDLVEEVKQLLRVQLLVPKDGKPPGIGGYRGKGPLRGWVRITATRELIRHKKKQARHAEADRSLDRMIASEIDPQLEALKTEYRVEFAAALREAIDVLTPEDRTLLRQQIVDDMSIDEVGVAFGVHRATAARWLNRARAALVAATHQRLANRLDLPVEQIESVIRLVQSKLDASVIRYLKES